MQIREIAADLLPLFIAGIAGIASGPGAGQPAHGAGRQPFVVKVSFTPDYQSTDTGSDTIYYSPSRPLRWADFTGKPNKASADAAVCYSSFGYLGSSLQRGDTIFVTVTLQVFFVKSASWVLPGSENDYSLEHEQLHFDITRLSAAYYRKSVLTTVMHADDYDSYLQYLFLDAFRYMNHLQDQYDGETQHGMDHAGQARWEERVKGELIRSQ